MQLAASKYQAGSSLSDQDARLNTIDNDVIQTVAVANSKVVSGDGTGTQINDLVAVAKPLERSLEIPVIQHDMT